MIISRVRGLWTRCGFAPNRIGDEMLEFSRNEFTQTYPFPYNTKPL